MNRAALIASLFAGSTVAGFAACSDGDEHPASVEPAAEGGRDVASSEASYDPPDVVDSGPGFNKEGWVFVDFDPACAFFAAPSPDKMPPPIKWEACDAGLNPLGWTCRQILFDWPKSSKMSELAGASIRGWTAPNGAAWLMVSRYIDNYWIDLVAEADGPVHTAVSVPYGNCYITNGSLSAGRVAFAAVRNENNAKIGRWGAIGGSVDEVPRALESNSDQTGRGYEVGANAYFVYPDNRLNDWTPATNEVAKLGVTDPGQVGGQRFVGDTLFFDVGNNSYGRIKTFSLDAGLKDLVSFGNDVAHNAQDFGTDGVDMVWTEGTGRSGPSPAPWDKVDIMTTKFTTDATEAATTKRRLRSEPGTIGGKNFLVGCGFAAHDYSSTEYGTGTRLVRLSDGQSWRFTRFSQADGGAPFVFAGPLALTCDELFIRFGRNAQFNVARIRIDSLGPGEPAD